MKVLPQSSVSGLHPLVGHAYAYCDCSFLLSNENYENGIFSIQLGNPQGLKILVSGGSTSDIFYDGSWLRPLSRLLYKHCSVIYSCACVGYSTSQEVLRLFDAYSVLKPDIIISLNGINDFGCIQSTVSGSPKVHNYQHSLFSTLSELQTKSLNQTSSDKKREIVYARSGDDFDNWYTNIQLMNSLSYCCTFSLSALSWYKPYCPPVQNYYLALLTNLGIWTN